MKLQHLLTNKWILYILLLMTITNIVGYLAIGDNESLAFFVALGVLLTFFSKNMIVVLSVTILATNVLFARNRVREGLENNKNAKKAKKQIAAPKKRTKKPTKKPTKERVKKEQFVQQNIRPSQPAPASAVDDEVPTKRIDYASTLEQAYDNLQKMLGPDGINGLSNETKKLVSQQKNLMQNLNEMGPVLKTAKDTLNTLGTQMPNLENLQSMMQKLTGGILGKKK